MNINEASREELEAVAQIDGTRAEYLINYRREHGAFKSWEDVEAVPSFDEGMVHRMRDAGFTLSGGRAEGERREASREQRDEVKGGERDAAPRTPDLNSASAEELEETHMIDGERARRLVEHRKSRGQFTSWDEVKDVTGFEDGLIVRLQEAGFVLKGS